MQADLAELRQRIIISFLALIMFVVLSFFFVPNIIHYGQSIVPGDIEFFVLRPGELFFTYLKVACITSLFLSLPIFLWQFLDFVLPGLLAREKKYLYLIVVGGYISFVLGVFFGLFLLIKPVLGFLFGFGSDMGLVQPQYDLAYYIDFLISFLVLSGFVFELPVVLILLHGLGIVDISLIEKYLKQIIFGLLCLAAVLTPTPDPVNMLILAGVLLILLLISIFLIKLIKRKNKGKSE